MVTLLVVIAAGVGLYLIWPPGSPREHQAGTAKPKWQSWYLENRPTWEAFDYVAIADEAGLADSVPELVRKRYPGPEINEELLIRDVSAFLYALAAPDPREYLRRAAPYRQLRSDVYSYPFLHTWYRVVTGAPMPADIDARAALKTLWEGPPGAPARPVAVSRAAVVQVAKTRPISAGKRDPHSRLYALTLPHFSCWDEEQNEHWVGSFSEGFPRLTVAAETFEEVMKEHGGTLVALYYCAVRTSDDKVFTIGLDLYFSPGENRWQVDGAGNYYPHNVCWPY